LLNCSWVTLRVSISDFNIAQSGIVVRIARTAGFAEKFFHGCGQRLSGHPNLHSRESLTSHLFCEISVRSAKLPSECRVPPHDVAGTGIQDIPAYGDVLLSFSSSNYSESPQSPPSCDLCALKKKNNLCGAGTLRI
jgi:hypothetical protein